MEKYFEKFLADCEPMNSMVQFSNKINAYQYRKPFTITSRFLKPAGRVLDWGCGNGHFSMFLLYNKQKTTAYGFGESSASPCIADDPLLEFVAADTREPVKLPFAAGSFDLVVSMGVLEHVHDSGGEQLASLQEIKRILKPGGFFLCFHFPYCGSWVERLICLCMPFVKMGYVHTKRFSKNDVMQLCNDANIHFDEWGRYNFLPRNISQKLPCSVTNNDFFLALFNAVDRALSLCLPWFCNQSYFIAQKADNPE